VRVRCDNDEVAEIYGTNHAGGQGLANARGYDGLKRQWEDLRKRWDKLMSGSA
jgi:hypothetical protein